MPSENTIFEVCQYLRNWFDRDQLHYFGTITIENGALSETYGLKSGQYFRIVKSAKNDGVYKYPVSELSDETFGGAIIGMGLKKPFIALLDDIEAWRAKYEAIDSKYNAMSPYSSESFGEYARSGGMGAADTSKDKAGTVFGVFGARLAPWRKV